VELSERWLYQEFGLPAQPGNGYQTVGAYWSYIQAHSAGKYPLTLVTPANATAGSLGPGDVVSYANVNGDNGHTNVVTSTSPAPFNGTGTVTTLNENSGGFITVKVTNWQFGIDDFHGNYMAATGWLHYTGASGHTWGNALEVPGSGSLNVNGAQVFSVSCASAGNCSVGGNYTDGNGHGQALVASQVNGSWHTAREVPRSGTLNVGGNAQILSVSCASAGNCSAGGFYTDSNSHGQAFVVSQVNGVWGNAKELPGTAALNQGFWAQVTSVSCRSAGNCSAGGYYTDGTGAANTWAFVASQVNGTWGTAREVPGLGAIMSGGASQILSVSCASPGNCGAGGFYTDGFSNHQAFTVDQVHGTWGTAHEVPHSGTLNTYWAQVTSVSCASAGNCSAGGYYNNSAGQQVFVASETNGKWGNAEQAPGSAALNTTGDAQILSVSCGSAGNCSAGGYYGDSNYHHQAFILNQVNGIWGKAVEAPGTAGLNVDFWAQVTSVSCLSAGNCSAGGYYTDGTNNPHAFVMDQVNGTWNKAVNVPGLANLNAGSSAINSVSCVPAGSCSAGGYYGDSNTIWQAMVVSKQ
jgi:hypothetical protein